MFGSSDNSAQTQQSATVHPSQDVAQSNQQIPAAGPTPQDDATTNFLAASPTSNDPFGTTPTVDDPSAIASPSAVNDATQHVTDDVVHDDKLIDIKQQALQQLSPLVEHLEQSPEEKFKTTMMMIQASDDKSLIPKAFEAAKSIHNDKERAQALLDIINEINYFTQVS
ncbi:MAG: hypothetical protein MUF85_03080 [Patescibacteria group bacterium]|jgi:hypothetical protein|nr:hypothetical protein [Patescibacteria group bacterium]